MRIGVVGLGVVGRRVVAALAAEDAVDEVLVVGGMRPGGSEKVRTVDEGVLEADADAVVLATPAPQQPAARFYLRAGRAVVTTSDDCVDIEALIGLERLADEVQRPLLVGGGAAPGLTGLLARLAAAELDVIDEIHVAVHGTGGPVCARQHHDAVGSSGRFWYDGAWQDRPGGTGRELYWFPDPVGARDCYRAGLADPSLLHPAFPSVARITARMSATRRDRFTSRLPMLRPPHPESLEGAVRVEVRGAVGASRQTVVLGAAAPLGTIAGATAAAAALTAAEDVFPAGLVVLGQEKLPTALLAQRVAANGVALNRFVGTAAQTSW